MANYPKPRRWIPKNPHKFVGDVNNIIARSSWEIKFLNWCDMNSSVLLACSEEVKIPYYYSIDNKMHTYYVDFLIKVKTIDNAIKTYLVEIKPHNQTFPPIRGNKKTKTFLNESLTWSKNEAKWTAATAWCKAKGIEFIILTEHQLFGK